MKRLYPLAILLLSFSLSSCGDDSDPIPESELPTIEESYTAERREILESLGINPDELDEEVFGVYIHDHFLVVSALRKTDEKLIVAVFDSIKNTQVIHDYSIAAPKTATKPYYDEQVEYRLRSITPQIIRINDGFICVVEPDTYPNSSISLTRPTPTSIMAQRRFAARWRTSVRTAQSGHGMKTRACWKPPTAPSASPLKER